MALKYREELVGKRFLALKDPKVQIPASPKSPTNRRTAESEEELSPEELIKQVQSNLAVLDSLETGDWLSGVIRAATDKDHTREDFQVLVEFDHLHWSRRDWVKPEDLKILLVEETLLLAHRTNAEKNKKTWSPALKFKYLKDRSGTAGRSLRQPVQFLIDNKISLVSSESTLSYKESARGLEEECRLVAQRWLDYQDGQSILVSTPTVLVGYRVQVYRTEGTTQWFTAVIQNYHELKKELSLLDDTVLEEHYESAELTQIIPLDGVVESILNGTQVRITQRRSRACKDNKSSETTNNKSNSSTENKTTSDSGAVTSQAPLHPSSSKADPPSRRSKTSATKSTSQVGSSSPKHLPLARQHSSSSVKSAGRKSGKNSPALEEKRSRSTTPSSPDKNAPIGKQDPLVDKKLRESVIQQVPSASPNKPTLKKSNSFEAPLQKKLSRKRKSGKTESSPESLPETLAVSPALHTLSISLVDNVKNSHSQNNQLETTQLTNPQDPQQDQLDMHFKKKRILAASSPEGAARDEASPPVSAPPPSLPPPDRPPSERNLPSHSAGNTSGAASTSGYSSTATTDSNMSPKERLSAPAPPIPAPPAHALNLPTAALPTAAALSAGLSAGLPLNPGVGLPPTTALRPPAPSPRKPTPPQSEPPVVPYRDPELLKKDAESRLGSHPTVTSSASRPLAAPGPPPSNPAISGLPTQLTNPMSNPQLMQQQLQLMSQLQLASQFSQMQAMRQFNPALMLQQQTQQWAQTLQQQMVESMYRTQGAPGIGAHGLGGAAVSQQPWAMLQQSQFRDDKHLAELQRLHEIRVHEQKEQERVEREKAEKERLERMERRLRVERGKILKESKESQLAQDAVNQHFSASLNRIGMAASAPVSPWPSQRGPSKYDDHQPQDLSTKSKALAGSDPSLDNKQKVVNRQHEAFVRSMKSSPSDTQNLVEEHFRKAAVKIPSGKESQPEFSLYGFQSNTFPNKYVSKDQIAHLNRDDNKKVSAAEPHQNIKSSKTSEATQTSQCKTYQSMIEQGLIPNPAHTFALPPNSALAAMTGMFQAAQRKADVPTDGSSGLGPGGAPNSGQGGGLMKSFKTYVENAVTQAFLKDYNDEEQRKKSSPPAGTQPIKSECNGMTGTPDTDSDTLSAPSPTLNSSAQSDNNSRGFHPKMKFKQEWRQRHEGSNQSLSPTGPGAARSATHSGGESTTSASEAENGSSPPVDGEQGSNSKSRKRKSADSTEMNSNGIKKSKNSEVSTANPSNIHPFYNSRLAGGDDKDRGVSHPTLGFNGLAEGLSPFQAINGLSTAGLGLNGLGAGRLALNGLGDRLSVERRRREDELNSIRQLAEIAFKADNMPAVPYASKPLVRVNITTLKKTCQAFVQDGSCIEMAPKQTKCRECKLSPNTNKKKIHNIFCRFFAFRMLKFNRGGQIAIAGFCDPSDAEADDITIWLPHINPNKSRNITPSDIKTAKYIVANVGDEFCRLVEQETECQSWTSSTDNVKRAWKRAVQGVREMCDVCETTLFNTHWVCHRCGFVVCLDCYRVKRKIRAKYSYNVDEENRRWVSCTINKAHEADRLMLTSIIPGDALKIAGDLIHHVRRKHSIPSNCSCGKSEETTGADTTVASGAENESPPVNGTQLTNGHASSPDDPSSSSPHVPRSSHYKSTEDQFSDDPLSLLADVASLETKALGANPIDAVTNGLSPSPEADSNGTVTIGGKLTLRGLLSKRGLTNSEDARPDIELKYYQRRSGNYLVARHESVPVCNLEETSLIYPDIKHSWLCNGRLLRLHEAHHPDNFKLFNQRWKLGQPVIVSGVSANMKVKDLWTPKAFSRDFGSMRHDLIDCRRNESLSQYQIKHFWDGFEDLSKRLEDNEGNPMILKLKDWPTGDDFAEIMPERFQDLMSALPMPQYTKRNGELNLAGRLPDFFVKPDLGPKMYNAYGLAAYPQSGTTNLHLDISDAVNVMVYVSDEKHLHQAVKSLINSSDCDDVMRKRVFEDGEIPGALWHIFDACDADKMRDLLNKVAEEQGLELEPYHDPIHDQQFYLDQSLRERLYQEYGVRGYAIIQCVGDSVFIPAGAPHQVQNLNGCIKVAEDFVSPEHLHHCFNLTQEFRHLSNTHTNHEDKLQVKNIIYHAVKEAVAILDQTSPIPDDS